jgi:hypothetical protein
LTLLGLNNVAASPLPIDEVHDKAQQMGPNQERSQEENKEPQATNPESIDLGSFDLVQALNADLVAARPKPKGLLPVPPEVQDIIAKEEARLLNEKGIVPTPEARQRFLDSLTLQYYYEGFYVAYRPTSQGPEVLAVGHEQIGQLLRGLDQEERLKIKVLQP